MKIIKTLSQKLMRCS